MNKPEPTEGKLDHPLLAEHAAEIRRLGKRVIADVIEIGRRLTEAKAIAGHGNWISWLEREFGWTDDTALNFMRCHELAKNRNFRDLSLPVSGLYLLAAPSTPDEVRDAVIARAAAGEKVTTTQVKTAITAKRPKRTGTGMSSEERRADARAPSPPDTPASQSATAARPSHVTQIHQPGQRTADERRIYGANDINANLLTTMQTVEQIQQLARGMHSANAAAVLARVDPAAAREVRRFLEPAEAAANHRGAYLAALRGANRRQRIAELRALLHELDLNPHDLLPSTADADDDADLQAGEGGTKH